MLTAFETLGHKQPSVQKWRFFIILEPSNRFEGNRVHFVWNLTAFETTLFGAGYSTSKAHKRREMKK
jgi:hypothetical protein